MVENGYISQDGAPLKCFSCQGKEFKEANVDRLDGWRDVLEYDMKCEKV